MRKPVQKDTKRVENNQSLVLVNNDGSKVTNSLIIAKIFGKHHQHVLRDIRNLSCSENFRQSNFGHTHQVQHQNGQSYPMCEITKDGFSFLVMGYTGARASEFKERFINEFNSREEVIVKQENLLSNDDYILQQAQNILTKRVNLLEEKNKQQSIELENKTQHIEYQQKVLNAVAPKVYYHDEILQSKSLIATNVIAKEHGMSAISLNKLLHQKGIIYRSNNVWVLYSKYQNESYTNTKTYSFINSKGDKETTITTYWTEKGRKFIHNLLKTNVKNKLSLKNKITILKY